MADDEYNEERALTEYAMGVWTSATASPEAKAKARDRLLGGNAFVWERLAVHERLEIMRLLALAASPEPRDDAARHAAAEKAFEDHCHAAESAQLDCAPGWKRPPYCVVCKHQRLDAPALAVSESAFDMPTVGPLGEPTAADMIELDAAPSVPSKSAPEVRDTEADAKAIRDAKAKHQIEAWRQRLGHR